MTINFLYRSLHMIVQTKPLRTKLKHTQSPLDDFKTMNNRKLDASVKEVLFVRYIGIPYTSEDFISQIRSIDDYFSNIPSSHYIRLQGLEKLTNPSDISRLSEVWKNWEIYRSGANPSSFYEASLGIYLEDEVLEWTKKLLFLEVIETYNKNNPNTNETILKNFAIKFIYWIEIYLPKLLRTRADSSKVLFIGDIKSHEILFLYFLSRLGCDICYMNPEKDIVHLHPDINKFSTLYMCKTVLKDKLIIPDYTPIPARTDPPLQNRIPTFVHAAPPKKSISKPPGGELSYEQLASMANSVVMIKTFDQENKVMCFGSGVILHSQGYILTNLHVVEGGHHFTVLYENETEEYVTDYLIKYHSLYDLAVIKVERKSSPLTVKTANNSVRGQKIVAIGSPLGLFNSVSDGIVSGFRDIRSIPMIQFTAPISDGSSGGALLDMYGRLVGLITAGFDQGQNLNLAVPSDKIYEFAHNFIEHSE